MTKQSARIVKGRAFLEPDKVLCTLVRHDNRKYLVPLGVGQRSSGNSCGTLFDLALLKGILTALAQMLFAENAEPGGIQKQQDPADQEAEVVAYGAGDKSNECGADQRADVDKGVLDGKSGVQNLLLMVRRISLGMTTRPRSSMRRTIPVAFIYNFLLRYHLVWWV